MCISVSVCVCVCVCVWVCDVWHVKSHVELLCHRSRYIIPWKLSKAAYELCMRSTVRSTLSLGVQCPHHTLFLTFVQG
jgi:hypothetical protein